MALDSSKPHFGSTSFYFSSLKGSENEKKNYRKVTFYSFTPAKNQKTRERVFSLFKHNQPLNG
jgi:hypothetical protein